MKNLILFALLFLSVKLTAQTKDSSTKKEVYLEININYKPYRKDVLWNFNVISGLKYLVKDSFPVDFYGYSLYSYRDKDDIFEALNKKSWELISAYTIQKENTTLIYYVFKKELY